MLIDGMDCVLDAPQVFAATKMNDHSSRSHTIFIVTSRQLDENGQLCTSRLHLVDLAGCEQLKQSQVAGQQRKEAVNINSSLMVYAKMIATFCNFHIFYLHVSIPNERAEASRTFMWTRTCTHIALSMSLVGIAFVLIQALKKCIRALVKSQHHIPYHDSTLTLLLRTALGGASMTSAIITGAPEDCFAAQTIQALRFGEAIAQVTNSVGGVSSLSAKEAFDQLEKSLSDCRATLASLSARGKTHLEAYQKAERLARGLEQKLESLARLAHK